MNVDKLSERLSNVASYIPKGARLADIGSDHAYLPCHVVKKNLVPFAIAGEVVEGPYQSAKKQVELEELTDRISVRKGNGLAVIEKGEVDCITIAGMGGTLIATILDEGRDKLEGVKKLVLQPNISAISIRTWLLHNDWQLKDEAILEEDGKIYEIVVAEKGNDIEQYEDDREQKLLLGPFLVNECSPVFKKKWSAEIRNWQHIIDNIKQSQRTEENLEKLKELQSKISLVEEVLGR